MKTGNLLQRLDIQEVTQLSVKNTFSTELRAVRTSVGEESLRWRIQMLEGDILLLETGQEVLALRLQAGEQRGQLVKVQLL